MKFIIIVSNIQSGLTNIMNEVLRPFTGVYEMLTVIVVRVLTLRPLISKTIFF